MAKPTKRKRGLAPASNSYPDLSLLGEDSWVIVKKQRVTILVPPLPVAKKSAAPNVEPGQQQALPRKKRDDQSEDIVKINSNFPSQADQEKSNLLVLRKAIDSDDRSPARRNSNFIRSPVLDSRRESEHQHQVGTIKSGIITGVSNKPKSILRLRAVHHHVGPIAGNILGQRLRAINLEKKLQKAGGLSQWLSSLGLEQFVRIFRARSVSKFQLVNLTMKKLKDMGAEAVGPRRKLIHAIDCVCQPLCFETVQKFPGSGWGV